METLNYEVLKKSGYDGYVLKDAPEKVLQFGEGNFLRAFVDRFFDLGNEATGWNGKIVMVQPISGNYGFADGINAQDDLYTVLVRGRQDGQTVDEARMISSCSRCLNPYRENDYAEIMKVAVSDDLEIIVSNTTEAGIAYDDSCAADDQPQDQPEGQCRAHSASSRSSSRSCASSSAVTVSPAICRRRSGHTGTHSPQATQLS